MVVNESFGNKDQPKIGISGNWEFFTERHRKKPQRHKSKLWTYLCEKRGIDRT